MNMKKSLSQNNFLPPDPDPKAMEKALTNTKYLFGERVKILSGFFKGTKGWVINFRQDVEEKVIGVPPYTQTMKAMVITYNVRLVPTKNMFIDIWIPENSIKKCVI